MKAAYFTEYGTPDVLEIREIDKPKVNNNEILVKVKASTVTAADARIRGSDFPGSFWLMARMMFGLFKPRKNVPGFDLAGEVIEAGKDIKSFKPGDKIFGSSGSHSGTHAEYTALPDKVKLSHKPEDLSFEDAATIAFSGATALYFLRKGNVKEGTKVLVYGASGAIGTYAVQIAVEMGAEVTGLCSTANIELVKSLGADNVIDYTKDDLSNYKDTFDVIFDTVGKSTFKSSLGALRKKGRYLQAVGDPSWYFRAVWENLTSGKKSIGGITVEKTEDFDHIAELITSGKVKPVIEKRYTLDQIAEAHALVDTGHKKGHVVIKFDEE